MARLNLLSFSLFVAAGVVSATALLPFSNWSFRNQLSALTAQNRQWMDHRMSQRVDSPMLTGDIWDMSNRDHSLARAFAIYHRWTPVSFDERGPYVRRPWFLALEQHAERFPNDVEGFATHARLLCQSPMIKPATDVHAYTGRNSGQEAERQIQLKTQVASKLLEVASRGSRLEPDNLFFAYCRMMALNVLGRHGEARRLAYDASKLRRFEDYSLVEGIVLIRTVEPLIGYRGEAFRTVVLASIALSHYASIKGTVQEMISRCPPEEVNRLKWALYQMQHTLARESSTIIGILVGKTGMDLALAKQGEIQSSESDVAKRKTETRDFLRNQAQELSRALRKKDMAVKESDPVQMFDEVEHLVESGQQTIDTTSDPIFDNLFRWSALAGRILMGFAGLLLALPALLIWSKRAPESFDRARGALAVGLAGLVMAIFMNVQPDSIADHVPLVLSLPFILLAVLRARDITHGLDVIALVAAGCFVALTAGIFMGLTASGLTLVLTGLAWLSGRWGWLASIIGLALAAVLTFSMRAPEFASMGILIAVPTALAAGCLLLALPSRWVGHGAACVILALSGAYVVAVSKEVTDNAKLKSFNTQFVSEAAIVRERAGLPRLSREYPVDGAL